MTTTPHELAQSMLRGRDAQNLTRKQAAFLWSVCAEFARDHDCGYGVTRFRYTWDIRVEGKNLIFTRFPNGAGRIYDQARA